MVRRFKELVAFILTKKSILNTYDGSDKIDEAGNIHRLVFSFSFEPEKTLLAKQSVRRRKKRVKGEQKKKNLDQHKQHLKIGPTLNVLVQVLLVLESLIYPSILVLSVDGTQSTSYRSTSSSTYVPKRREKIIAYYLEPVLKVSKPCMEGLLTYYMF